MIEYIVLGVCALIFLFVLMGVGVAGLIRAFGAGVGKVSAKVGGIPAAVQSRATTLADLVEQHVAQAEAADAAAKRKAALDARLAGLVGDAPKDAPPAA